jgi:hypothetical protein
MPISGLEFEEVGYSSQKNGVTILAKIADPATGGYKNFLGTTIAGKIYMSPAGALMMTGFSSSVVRREFKDEIVQAISYENGKVDSATADNLKAQLSRYISGVVSGLQLIFDSLTYDPEPAAEATLPDPEPDAPTEEPPTGTFPPSSQPSPPSVAPRPVSFNRKKGGR